MAHELEIGNNGVAKMMYAGAVPWHGLGVSAGDEPVDAETAMRLAQLKSRVVMRDLTIRHGDQEIRVPQNVGRAIVREDDGKVLGMSGRLYQPIQNEELFNFCQDVADVADGKVVFETAGSLRDGQIVWALGRLQDGFEPILGDRHIPYIWATNSHNGKDAMHVGPVTTRVVCKNTWNAARGEGGLISIRHTSSKDDRMKEAARILGEAMTRFKRDEEELTKLANRGMTPDEWENFLLKLFPIPMEEGAAQTRALNRHALLNRLRFGAVGQKGVENTFYGAFNALTFFTSHEATVKNVKGGNSRTESVLLGSGADLNARARTLLLSMV